MAITLPGSINGAAQTGFTTPGYTTSVDTAPDVNAKQVAVTAITGTQVGVTAHTVASPFTLAFWRPKVLQLLGRPNNITGRIENVPFNTYKCITRKGVTPASGQSVVPMVIKTEISVPAGSDTFDAANVRAAVSAHVGLLSSISAGVGDTATNGLL